MKKQRNFVIGLIIAILLVIFALINQTPVMIQFGFTKVKLPLILILFISILLGALVTYLFATTGNYNLKKEMKDLRGQVTQLETEQQKAIDTAVDAATAKQAADFKAQLAEKEATIEQLKAAADATDTATTPKNEA